jgi:hypothetical protein
MITREVTERNQILGNASSGYLGKLNNETARLCGEFEEEENTLRFEPHISESVVIHIAACVQILGIITLSLPLIEIYQFNGWSEQAKDIITSSLSPTSLFEQLLSFFTWPHFEPDHDSKGGADKHAQVETHRGWMNVELSASVAIISTFMVKVI